jgi:glucose-1-phosphate adenylyltransferase
MEEATRFGILAVGEDGRVTDFVEKPPEPPSNLANMGVYLFNTSVLDQALWEDHMRTDSDHDFGKNILPSLVKKGMRVFAFPYRGYWVDVGTIESYWKAHMDLLDTPPPIDLNDRKWIIHTRTEERSPVRIARGAEVLDSMIADGCVIPAGARVERSVLSPGVRLGPGAVVRESVILTDTVIEAEAVVEQAIIEKRVHIGERARVGTLQETPNPKIAMVGKNSHVLPAMAVEPGGLIGPDVVESDYASQTRVRSGDMIETKRMPYET